MLRRSALGREFSHALIASVTSLPEKDLNAALTQLVNAELVFQRGAPPDATYQFKHALVQDAAYDSLLRTRRQVLHAKIAGVMEEDFSGTTDPGVLAYHYTEAAFPEHASAYWLSAGRASLEKFALTESVRQLRLGLEQIAHMPLGTTRDRRELDTQLCLGNTLLQAKGLASPDVDAAYKRAYALRGTIDQSRELIQILFGILVVILHSGRPRAALGIAEEMLSNAKGDRQSEMISHTLLMDVHFWLGNFERADQHFARALPLYDDDSDPELMKTYAFDLKMVALVYASNFQWIVGYPERALHTKQSADAWAKHLNTPFMYTFVNLFGSTVLHYCGHFDKQRLQVDDGFEIAQRVGFPFFIAQAGIWSAWNRVMRGEVNEETLALFENGLTNLVRSGGGSILPYFRALYAQALSEQGRNADALRMLHEAVGQIEDFGEQVHAAEVHRIRGTVLVREGGSKWHAAEEAFRTSLSIARRQGAKSWELRGAMSYARLLMDQGRRAEAHDLLAPIYGWFTEGFETPDLQDANALLNQLQGKI